MPCLKGKKLIKARRVLSPKINLKIPGKKSKENKKIKKLLGK